MREDPAVPPARCDGNRALQRRARGRRIAPRKRLSRSPSEKNARKFGRILFDSRDFAAQWMRAGLHDHRSNWGRRNGADAPSFATAYAGTRNPWRRRPFRRTRPRRAKVIAFANQKGGVAKTTSTLNLAAALAEKGHRVLCVDMDPQGNLTMSQGLNPDSIERSMFDVLVHRLPIENVIEHDGDRPGRVVDRPRRRRARALEHDRPRARAREGARSR